MIEKKYNISRSTFYITNNAEIMNFLNFFPLKDKFQRVEEI